MIPQHILVPIDFSAYATQALEYAVTLATKLQAHVTLLHAIHPLLLSAGPADMGVIVGPYIEELEADTRRAIEEFAQRVREADVECDTVIRFGTPFQEILDFVGTHQIDLTVMGSHGRTGLLHTLLGSVAERVVRLAPCPVLIVRGADASTVQQGNR